MKMQEATWTQRDAVDTLEWELSLDARDLRSHAWYHGRVSRAEAEEMVSRRDGDFLVRDCSSQPGNYVLTCRSKGQALHFVVNKIILQPDTVYESVQYRFEEDGFDAVPDLITYYVGSGKPVTSLSGAKIQTPCNRRHPLSSYYVSCCDAENSAVAAAAASVASAGPAPSPPFAPANRRRTSRRRLPSATVDDGDAADLGRSSLPRATPRTSEGAAVADSDAPMTRNRRTCRGDSWPGQAGRSPKPSAALLIESSLSSSSSSSSSPPPPPSPLSPSISSSSSSSTSSSSSSPGHCRASEPISSAHDEPRRHTEEDAPSPPPKPSRLIGRPAHATTAYGLAGRDSGYGPGDVARGCAQQRSWRAALRRRSSSGVVVEHPEYRAGLDDAVGALQRQPAHEATIGAGAGYCYEAAALENGGPRPAFATSMPQLPSAFDLDNFHTLLLPIAENKPLDGEALRGLHSLLVESGSRILANHLTRVDLALTVADLGAEYATACLCKTGVELVTLPHGRQRRSDLIERTECIKLLVATTILTCGTESERTELLNKWIEVAIDAKTALGNLYGFCAIMLGLCTPQIQRLNETWHILRQKFTDSAFNFEAKLRSTLKSMNESTNPLAPNTTIPHLLPLLLLYESGADPLKTDGGEACSFRANQLPWPTIDEWETSTPDQGLSTWYAHLDSSRHFCRSLSTFCRNAEIVLADAKVDDLLLDVFRTEFHLKFLWGSRGATADATERHRKFQQILTVMSEKCETYAPVVGEFDSTNDLGEIRLA